MGRKSSGSSGIAIGVLVVLGVVAQAIQNYWPILLILGGAALAYWFLNQSRQASTSQQDNSMPHKVSVSGLDTALYAYSTPTSKPMIQDGDQLWLPAGKSTTVAGYVLNGGFLYVGKGLAGGNDYRIEAALIDPSLAISDSDNDYAVRKLNYWPSYSESSSQARASYLHWLATGRSDPNADIGYVFLYFYGLERRALLDTAHSPKARDEVPTIMQELQRLLSIYGDNRSFYQYATSLLNLLQMKAEHISCGDIPPPLSPFGGLTFTHRFCLGQMSVSRTALTCEWAYLWLMGDPNTRLKTPAQRCPDEFKRAFMAQYTLKYGDGMLLPQNKTRLKISHRPASPTLRNSDEFEISFDLPDVTVLSSPLKKLNTIAESCIVQLESYSRFLGRNPDKVQSADAMLELPFALWPDQYRKPIEKLKDTIRTAGMPMATKFERLRALFPDWHDVNRQRYQSLTRAFSEIGMGIEPDFKFSGKLPSLDGAVVLFSDDAIQSYREPSPEYSAAALTLHLAVSVSAADGEVSADEKHLLLHQLENWLHLHDSARHRLQAHLRWLMSDPPGLGSLKKRIESLSLTARQTIGGFLTEVAKADNNVTPEEVKLLEKIFKILGLDVQSVYSMLHIAAEAPVTVRPSTIYPSGFAIPSPPKPQDAGIDLDMDRVAVLHAESVKVTAMLSDIFTETAVQPIQPVEPIEIETVVEDSIMGLDAEHTALIRLISTRPKWNRDELEELAQDRGILLDGALEHINEASFDTFDQPFCEGDEPIEINQEVVKEIIK